jgi:hypothetical protein
MLLHLELPALTNSGITSYFKVVAPTSFYATEKEGLAKEEVICFHYYLSLFILPKF